MQGIKKNHTRVGDESLMDRIGYQGSDHLWDAKSEDGASRQQFRQTHDALGGEIVLLAVMSKVIEDLGTSDYATGR